MSEEHSMEPSIRSADPSDTRVSDHHLGEPEAMPTSPQRSESMPSRVLTREVCHKRGAILTCYVNGRKRFRAIGLDDSSVIGHELVAPGLALQAVRSTRPADTSH